MTGKVSSHDRGSILPIVLVVCFVLALIILGLAKYATTTLRYGQVVEQSADRLAAAQGGMENALEDLRRGSSPCTMVSGSELSGGYTYPLGDTINDIRPDITCELTAGEFTAVDGFAVMLTGLGGQTGPLLYVSGGGSSANAIKTFEGPIYMARPPDAASHTLVAELNLKRGDLWYSTASSCPDPGEIDPAVVLDDSLTILDGYTTKCVADSWSSTYQSKRPPEPDPLSFSPQSSSTPSPVVDCYVWEAGRYSSAPQLAAGSYNYFKSGNYYFENIGEWTLQNSYVLAGNKGEAEPGITGLKDPSNPDTVPSFLDNPCLNAYGGPDNGGTDGATFYMGGNSKISLSGTSALEVTGKVQSGGYNVALQALDFEGVASTITGDDRIVHAGGGSNKQLSMGGFVWAQRAGFEFGQVANDAVAALNGGAVVAELSAGASANANNFVIRVDTQPKVNDYIFTSSARSKDGGVTSVRSVVSYRTDRNYAVSSRRVVGITPE